MRGPARTFLLILIFAALSVLGYVKFLRPRFGPSQSRQALTRLSELVDAHIDAIFSPLNGTVTPIPHHELRKLREQFIDSAKSAAPQGRATYLSAARLCDALLLSIQERERETLSLADTRSKAYAVGLSADQKKDLIDKTSFFEFGITRRWAESAKQQRVNVNRLYTDLRAKERAQGVPDGAAH